MEGRFTGECFGCTMVVQLGKVDNASHGALLFPDDHHTVTPCHCFMVWHTFNDAKGFMMQELIEYALLPMHCQGSRIGCALP